LKGTAKRSSKLIAKSNKNKNCSSYLKILEESTPSDCPLKRTASGGNSMAQMDPQDQMLTGASSQAATKLPGFHTLKHK
jgi:hypothetical protein